MIDEKLLDVLNHEGVVAIATQGENGPHLVNTWNSYVKITDDSKFIYPAAGMHTTEANINKNNHVLITVGSREVAGAHGPGTGYLIQGTASFVNQGPVFDEIKQRFPWSRSAVEVNMTSVTRTL